MVGKFSAIQHKIVLINSQRTRRAQRQVEGTFVRVDIASDGATTVFTITRYNCAMEASVGEFLKTCPTAGTPESARFEGENFISMSESGIADYTAAIQKAVTSWWKVVRTTDGIGMAVTFRVHHVNAPIASFTQMAWATSRKLGCAVARCSGRYIAACRYSPKGNNVEQVVYARGAPCTACPAGAWCTSGALCTQP